MSEHQGPRFHKGQRIRIVGGTFERFEAVVIETDAATGRIHADIIIFGRTTPVELKPSDCQPTDDR